MNFFILVTFITKIKKMSNYKYILSITIFFFGILITGFVNNLFFDFETLLFKAIECTSYWFFFIMIYTRCKRKNKIYYPQYFVWLILSFISSTAISYLANIYAGENEGIRTILRPLAMNIFLAIVTLLLLIYKKEEKTS